MNRISLTIAVWSTLILFVNCKSKIDVDNISFDWSVSKIEFHYLLRGSYFDSRELYIPPFSRPLNITSSLNKYLDSFRYDHNYTDFFHFLHQFNECLKHQWLCYWFCCNVMINDFSFHFIQHKNYCTNVNCNWIWWIQM